MNKPHDSATAVPTAPPIPPAAAIRSSVDTIHGIDREDNYAWLREKGSAEVKEYLETENAYAAQVLAPTEPLQETIYQEIVSRIKQTDLSVPYRYDAYLYHTRTEEGLQYPILCRRRADAEDAPEEVLLDVNEMAAGHSFTALGVFSVSDDGNLLAYTHDTTGFREYDLRVKDLRSGVTHDIAAKVTSAVWAADNRTLFYSVESESTKRPYRIFRHELGGDDHLVFEETDEQFRLGVYRTRSRAYIFIGVQSFTTAEYWWLPADGPESAPQIMVPRRNGHEYYPDDHGDRFYFRTNDAGRNFRLVSAPVSAPDEENWTEVVPHSDDEMLEEVEFFANHYVLCVRRDGLPEIRSVDLRTGTRRDVAFPEPAYETYPATNKEWETNKLRYGYQSLVTPSSVFEYDMETGTSTLLKQIEVLGGYDSADYVSERLWVQADDESRVPVSLVRRRDTALDGGAPMLLTGYGSYGIPYPTAFSVARLSLLDRGFVVAIAHIRGGGELGKRWHDEGRMMNKMNTFNDFIRCADHLVEHRYTSRERLAIEGGSAGGLLMGAVINLRPDLCRAALLHVPFVDVINTMLDDSLPLVAIEYEEWGNPNVREEYDYISRYCPYTNLRSERYPAMLVRTSLNDSQVMYWEPAKYVAKLRTLKSAEAPLLFITNMGGGHGGSSGRYDQYREVALDYAFMLEFIDRS